MRSETRLLIRTALIHARGELKAVQQHDGEAPSTHRAIREIEDALSALERDPAPATAAEVMRQRRVHRIARRN